MKAPELSTEVQSEVNAWLQWLPKWRPQTHRGRSRVCPRCTGSPIAVAAGFEAGVPHQVVHGLLTRMHRIIDAKVDEYTREYLPMLQAELEGQHIWQSGIYNARSGLPAEADGIDPDLIYEAGEHPTLFTFAQFEEQDSQASFLSLPPLTQAEKDQLRKEIALADEHANMLGKELCFVLVGHQQDIRRAVQKFVEPHIVELLSELSKNLETPFN